jgi:hypothetical protein
LGFNYDFSAYPGRRRLWRVLYLIFSGAVVVISLIALSFLIEGVNLVFILQDPLRPVELTVPHLYNTLVTYQSVLIGATIVFGPWLCLLLISVASHPTNQPHHFIWFMLGSLSTILMVVIWAQWFFFTPTLLSLTGLSPTFPRGPINFPNTINLLWGIIAATLSLSVFVVLVSIAVWFRYIVY